MPIERNQHVTMRLSSDEVDVLLNVGNGDKTAGVRRLINGTVKDVKPATDNECDDMTSDQKGKGRDETADNTDYTNEYSGNEQLQYFLFETPDGQAVQFYLFKEKHLLTKLMDGQDVLCEFSQLLPTAVQCVLLVYEIDPIYWTLNFSRELEAIVNNTDKIKNNIDNIKTSMSININVVHPAMINTINVLTSFISRNIFTVLMHPMRSLNNLSPLILYSLPAIINLLQSVMTSFMEKEAKMAMKSQRGRQRG